MSDLLRWHPRPTNAVIKPAPCSTTCWVFYFDRRTVIEQQIEILNLKLLIDILSQFLQLGEEREVDSVPNVGMNMTPLTIASYK